MKQLPFVFSMVALVALGGRATSEDLRHRVLFLNPSGEEMEVVELSQSDTISPSAAVPIGDCSIRRVLYVREDSLDWDNTTQEMSGNFSVSIGDACGSAKPTTKFPFQPGCPWYFVLNDKFCPNGNELNWAEFGISEAHSKMFPMWEHGTCGNIGKNVYLKNSDSNRKIEVMIEVSSASTPAKVTPLTFDAGEKKNLGCTFVDGDARNYKILSALFK
jgi:hypothetical protein